MAQRNEGRHEIYDVDEDFDGLETSIAACDVMETQAMTTRGTNEATNQPTLPNGQVINSKNTLQSFTVPIPNEVPLPVVPVASGTVNRAGVTSGNNSGNNEATNQPRLPNGRVIDSKNTLQSFPVPIPTAFVVSDTGSSIVNAAQVTSANINNGNNTGQAPSIVEGVLVVTKSSWWVMITLAMICALVVTGVCASGKCSAPKSDPTIAKSGGQPITDIPTTSPTFSMRPSVSPAFPQFLTQPSPASLLPTLSPIFHPSMRPTLHPESTTLVERAVSSFIKNITFSKEAIIVNGTNPESRALTWLIYGDDTFNTSELLTLNLEMETVVKFRVRQRYVLAILWFQQADESGAFVKWDNSTGWLDESNECAWYGIYCDMWYLGDTVGSQDVVTYIDFSDNFFFGTIPPDIGHLPLLSHIDFSHNAVGGTFPESIVQCDRLLVIFLSFCSMNGTLPSSIGLWTDIFYFDVSFNNLNGTIPSSIGNWSQIEVASFDSNQFTGSIPTELCRHINETSNDIFVDCEVNCTCCKSNDDCG